MYVVCIVQDLILEISNNEQLALNYVVVRIDTPTLNLEAFDVPIDVEALNS